jgi:hypothetical protein
MFVGATLCFRRGWTEWIYQLRKAIATAKATAKAKAKAKQAKLKTGNTKRTHKFTSPPPVPPLPPPSHIVHHHCLRGVDQ